MNDPQKLSRRGRGENLEVATRAGNSPPRFSLQTLGGEFYFWLKILGVLGRC